MTKRVQLAGYTTESEQVLVGLERELRVDQDNAALRLHDGVKEGGYLFLNRDENDQRYQARSLELDGFDFTAQTKGILVRVGPASYKLRKVVSASGDITFLNIRGTSGDFDFRISDHVETPHTWDGVQTYSEAIVAEAGLDGETRGEHVGHVTGDVTGNLEGDAVGNHSGTFTGDVDVREHTILFDDGQIQEPALDPDILINRGVPLGAILLWSGSTEDVPDSWQICDGTNGTPDLRGRFVRGATGVSLPGATGGSDEIELTGHVSNSGSHAHPLSIDDTILTVDQMPEHKHANGVNDGNDGAFNYGGTPAEGTCTERMATKDDDQSTNGWTQTVGGGEGHSHTGDTTESGAHDHELTLDNAIILPSYYSLCYIMKIV